MTNTKTITCKNLTDAGQTVANLLEQNPKMRELRFCESGFYSKKNSEKEKVIVYVWHFNGEWADASKGIYTKLIEN